VPNDIQGWVTGTDDRGGYLRAERFEDSRIYTLTYEAADPADNTATCQTTVTVPMKPRSPARAVTPALRRHKPFHWVVGVLVTRPDV
jgi:hypothetical protein